VGSLGRDVPVDGHRVSVALAKRAVARLRMSALLQALDTLTQLLVLIIPRRTRDDRDHRHITTSDAIPPQTHTSRDSRTIRARLSEEDLVYDDNYRVSHADGRPLEYPYFTSRSPRRSDETRGLRFRR
jgi:hypothetical protein